jgi:hypothetical protein
MKLPIEIVNEIFSYNPEHRIKMQNVFIDLFLCFRCENCLKCKNNIHDQYCSTVCSHEANGDYLVSCIFDIY